MGLPTFQSLVTSVPNKYCLIRLGSVRAVHTFDAGAFITVVASAGNLLFISSFLENSITPFTYTRSDSCQERSNLASYIYDQERKLNFNDYEPASLPTICHLAPL